MVISKTRSKSEKRKEKHVSTSTTSKSDVETDLALSQSSPSSLATLVPSAEDVKDILTFETVKQLAEFYRAVGWSPATELQILINIIQTTDNDVTRLRALKDLQARRAEILRNSGLMVRATRVQKDADGGQTIFSANIVANALNYNPSQEESKEIKGAINEQDEQKKEIEISETPTEAPAEVPLRNDGDAGGGVDDGGAGDSDRAAKTDGTSGGDGYVDGHKPPTGGTLLTGIAAQRG